MKIAQIAPLVESVPPPRYGGTERVVGWLCDELVRRGHEVTLFASGDSVTSATLVPCAARALRHARVTDHTGLTIRMLGDAFERASEFDLLHSHVDFLAFPFTRLVERPVVHTIHGRLDLPHLPEIYEHYPDLALVSISNAQRLPLGIQRFMATVHHGLPRDLYGFRERADDYLLFLGRISPEKGPLFAVQAARRAGAHLVVAAKVDPADRTYFERDVRPVLSHPGIEFVGEISDKEKRDLLGRARALLAPIDWPEPFGLVFIESLACGTPVITRPCGSVSELLRHGQTALIATTLEETVAAIHEVESLDRRTCRLEFEARFTVDRMASDYERVYSQALSQRGPRRPNASVA
jgi:glycosyltransferase involved in cell wall biosynthesis